MSSQNFLEKPQVITCAEEGCNAWVGFFYPKKGGENQNSELPPIYCVTCMRRIDMVICALTRKPIIPEFYDHTIQGQARIAGRAEYYKQNTYNNLMRNYKIETVDGKDIS